MSIESIPDNVVELSEKGSYECISLRCVTFGTSKLELVCAMTFYETGIE